MTAIDIAEKLKLMEAHWDSLSVNTDDSYASPAWHEPALKQAEGDLAVGTAYFVDWTDAKKQLRERSGN